MSRSRLRRLSPPRRCPPALPTAPPVCLAVDLPCPMRGLPLGGVGAADAANPQKKPRPLDRRSRACSKNT